MFEDSFRKYLERKARMSPEERLAAKIKLNEQYTLAGSQETIVFDSALAAAVTEVGQEIIRNMNVEGSDTDGLVPNLSQEGSGQGGPLD